jgi:hypothetical protein
VNTRRKDFVFGMRLGHNRSFGITIIAESGRKRADSSP